MTETGVPRPGQPAWLRAERRRLLDFGLAAYAPAPPTPGFGWLDDDGRPDPDEPAPLWVCCRMTHVFALGALEGVAGCRALAEHGVASLRGAFRDEEHGGWFAALGADGPTSTAKEAYPHAFVVLAASTAHGAGLPGAGDLLTEALDVLLGRFWDDASGMLVEEWDRTFTDLDAYRGVNANMHAVEALLAASAVTGDEALLARALRIVTRVVHGLAREHGWRLPEHMDESWRPDLEHHADEPAHPFRPYGATVGHWFEWARLTVQLAHALGSEAPAWMLPDARALVDAGAAEGWAVDGSEGFVYTVDWSGRPVVRQRMHWVAAEAVAAAATLHAATGEAQDLRRYEAWWAYTDAHLLDRRRGSWWHELGPDNVPAATTWRGKPDLYHAVQATLIPARPLAVSVLAGLRAELADPGQTATPGEG